MANPSNNKPYRKTMTHSARKSIQFVAADPEHSADSFALRVREDSMEPEFQIGEIFVIDPAVVPRAAGARQGEVVCEL